MSETETTRNTPDEENVESVDATAPESTGDGKQEYEVCCVAISYFTNDPVVGPDGNDLTDVNGNVVRSMKRKDASLGQIVRLYDAQAASLLAEGAIQKPGAFPLVGDPTRPHYVTPFGVPLAQEDPRFNEVDQVRLDSYPMGHPAPAGPGTTDAELISGDAGKVMTEEQKAEYAAAAAKAAGADDPDHIAGLDEDTQASFDAYKELPKQELKDLAESKDLEVTRADGRTDLEPTVPDYALALARDDNEEGDES